MNVNRNLSQDKKGKAREIWDTKMSSTDPRFESSRRGFGKVKPKEKEENTYFPYTRVVFFGKQHSDLEPWRQDRAAHSWRPKPRGEFVMVETRALEGRSSE